MSNFLLVQFLFPRETRGRYNIPPFVKISLVLPESFLSSCSALHVVDMATLIYLTCPYSILDNFTSESSVIVLEFHNKH